jgi:Holliday junction resolvase-like predicted endonuclease
MEAQAIQTMLRQTAQAKVKVYPCNNVRASEIGHPCVRYLVFSITNWEDRKPHDASLQNIFDLGNAIETEVIRRLKEAGLEILTARKNFKVEKPLITGREDIMLQDPQSGELYPCEIKGLSPVSFDKIHSVDDMHRHSAYYIRKYPAQLQIYMYAHNKEKGYFILFNKITGQIKIIEVSLDYDYVEGLLKKTESVYEHIGKGTLPSCLDDETVCSDCPLLHICGANINRANAEIDVGEFDDILRRRDELLPFVKELGEIKKYIRLSMKNRERVFTPNYLVYRKIIRKKPFVVGASIYSKEIIKRIGGLS